MLFLLFLLLVTLGAQAEQKRAVCKMTERNITCALEDCPATNHVKARDNVICTCAHTDHQTKGSCTLEFRERDVDECTLRSVWETNSCNTGRKNCMEKCTETGLRSSLFTLICDCPNAEGAQNQGKKAEGAQNQGKKAEGAQNQGKKAEGAQNQGKKAEGAQNQGKKSEGAQNQGKKAEGVQNAEQLGEVLGTESGTETASAPNGNAEQSTQIEKTEKGASAAARNSHKAAYLYPLLSFIAAIPRRN